MFRACVDRLFHPYLYPFLHLSRVAYSNSELPPLPVAGGTQLEVCFSTHYRDVLISILSYSIFALASVLKISICIDVGNHKRLRNLCVQPGVYSISATSFLCRFAITCAGDH